jgi:hypothetical protein
MQTSINTAAQATAALVAHLGAAEAAKFIFVGEFSGDEGYMFDFDKIGGGRGYYVTDFGAIYEK